MPANLRFTVGDVSAYAPQAGTDVVVCNAVLQWVPEHRELLQRWAAALGPGASLAFQVPGNFSAPTHALMARLAASERWRRQLSSVLRHDDAVSGPVEYHRLLSGVGMAARTWETTYLHVLEGENPVLEWVRGTALRPVLAALSADEALEFERTYAALLAGAYPREPDGSTILPFRRIFSVGVKSPSA